MARVLITDASGLAGLALCLRLLRKIARATMHTWRCMTMRTNIVLDDDLVQEAMKIGHIKTKRQLVEQALREFVSFRKKLDLRDLRGSQTIADDYDYKSLRAGDKVV